MVEDGEHPAVVGQDLGDEPAHPELTSSIGQASEQDGAEAELLPAVRDHEGDLGLQRILEPIESGDGDDLVACGGHDGLTRGVVDMGEAVQLFVAQPRVHAEEPEVRRLGRQRAVEPQQPSRAAALIGCSRTVEPSRSSIGSTVSASTGRS